MKTRMFVVLSLAIAVPLVVSGCGVKTDLVTPAGKVTPKDQKDPSKPTGPNGNQ